MREREQERASISEGRESANWMMGIPSPERLSYELAYGDALMQLISVCFLGGGARRPPLGTVAAFDGKRGQILYSHSRDKASSYPCFIDHQGALNLLLTGPYRAISAEGSVAIELDLYDDSDQNAALHMEDDKLPTESATEILWNVYSENAEYDTTIEERVRTRCGLAEVKYIVWSNAVEGSVEVRLRLRDGTAGSPTERVHGRITAILRSSPDDAVVVLFDSELHVSPLEELVVPLARSVIAAPLMQPLKIQVDLHNSHSDKEIVSGSLEFLPELDDEYYIANQCLSGRNGRVDVKITCSD